MLGWIQYAWREHGTKVLGALGILLGALESMTLWFSPKGLQLVGALSMLVGGFTVRRGFTNSRDRDDADDQH